MSRENFKYNNVRNNIEENVFNRLDNRAIYYLEKYNQSGETRSQ